MKGYNHVVEKNLPTQYVALLPAAGEGTRLPDRILSKELLPFGGAETGERPVISHLLGSVAQAGIRNVIVVIRHGKADIPDYLAGQEWQHVDFTYEFTHGTSGVPETVALGLQDAGSRNVVFGFPDILFEPQDAYTKLMHELENSNSDVVLGLFPTESPGKMDMVEIDADSHVVNIEIKPRTTSLTLTWILAIWKPEFSSFLIDLIDNHPARINSLATGPGGSHLGHVFQLAMAEGLRFGSVSFEQGRSLDIGTPDDLSLARTWLD